MVRAVRLRALRRRARPTLREGVKQKAWFCGTPAQVIDGIKSIEAKYPGLEDFMIHWAEGLSPAEFAEQLRWVARDVMPAFGGGGEGTRGNDRIESSTHPEPRVMAGGGRPPTTSLPAT